MLAQLTDEDAQKVLQALFPTSALKIAERFQGNVNTVLKVTYGDDAYVLRVRSKEDLFKYERGLIKEAFIAFWQALPTDDLSDRNLRLAVESLLKRKKGVGAPVEAWFPKILSYDWTRELIAHPYCVYKWFEGQCLWSDPLPKYYEQAGELLANIHKLRFPNFYSDFNNVGREALDWRKKFTSDLEKEQTLVGMELSPRALKGLEKRIADIAAMPKADIDARPVLVHNDYSGSNIIVSKEKVQGIIDWDNAVIDDWRLDLVKMKHWTVVDDKGQLIHEPLRFAAFLSGYGEAAREAASDQLFQHYEVLWLMRVFNFECAKERSSGQKDFAPTSKYPAASHYRELLESILG